MDSLRMFKNHPWTSLDQDLSNISNLVGNLCRLTPWCRTLTLLEGFRKNFHENISLEIEKENMLITTCLSKIRCKYNKIVLANLVLQNQLGAIILPRLEPLVMLVVFCGYRRERYCFKSSIILLYFGSFLAVCD